MNSEALSYLTTYESLLLERSNIGSQVVNSDLPGLGFLGLALVFLEVAMKGQVFIEIVLIGMLGLYAWLLLGRMQEFRFDPRQEAIEASGQLLFTNATGIDIGGNRVDPAQIPNTNRCMAFLLRNTSLRADLNFWDNVASLLPKGSGVRLIGYCDGSACVEGVKNDLRLADFPVIAYGDVVDSQALLNADAAGNFLLTDIHHQPRSIEWRGLGPASVVRSVLP